MELVDAILQGDKPAARESLKALGVRWAAAGYELEGESGGDAAGGAFFFPSDAFEK